MKRGTGQARSVTPRRGGRGAVRRAARRQVIRSPLLLRGSRKIS